MRLPEIKTPHTTFADFPEQDWKLWEARRFNRPGNQQTIDTSYLDTRPCCILCATWTCAECWDWRRSRATRSVTQYCARCGGRDGFFIGVRHWKPHEALPQVPFVVPTMGVNMAESTDEQIVEAMACPAGSPCPATGCPACCPDYDPCGQSKCISCKGEKPVSQPRETSDDQAESEQQEAKCDWGCLTDGRNYPHCHIHGKGVKTLAEDRVPTPEQEEAETIYPFRDGNVYVLGPEIFVTMDGETIYWRGENYRRAGEPSVTVGSLHAAESADRQVYRLPDFSSVELIAKWRLEAMKLAQDLAKAHVAAGVRTDSADLVEWADHMYRWMSKQ